MAHSKENGDGHVDDIPDDGGGAGRPLLALAPDAGAQTAAVPAEERGADGRQRRDG